MASFLFNACYVENTRADRERQSNASAWMRERTDEFVEHVRDSLNMVAQANGENITFGEWEETKDLQEKIENAPYYYYGKHGWKTPHYRVDFKRTSKKGKKVEYCSYEVFAYSRNCYVTDLYEDAFAMITIVPCEELERVLCGHPLEVEDRRNAQDLLYNYEREDLVELSAKVNNKYQKLVTYDGRELNMKDYNLKTLHNKHHRKPYLKSTNKKFVPAFWDFSANVGIFGFNLFGYFRFIAGLVLMAAAIFCIIFPLKVDGGGLDSDDEERFKWVGSMMVLVSLLPLLIYWNSYEPWEETSGFVHFLAWVSIIAMGILMLYGIILLIKFLCHNRTRLAWLFPLVPILAYMGCMFLGAFFAFLADVAIVILIMKGIAHSSRGRSSSSNIQYNGHTISGVFLDHDTFRGSDGFVYKREYGNVWERE